MNRFYEWTGRKPAESRIAVGGGLLSGYLSKDIVHTVLKRAVGFVQGGGFSSVFQLNREKARDIAEMAKSQRIRVLTGYPSVLYLLAKRAEKEGLDSPTIKILHTTAERSYDFQREILERVFSADLYNQYSCGEIYAIAAECEQKGAYHVFDEHVIVERPSDGTDSKIMPSRITDLDNYAMPFIRYENGDVLDFSNTDCNCGRGLSTIRKVLGRTRDFLTASTED